MDLIDVIADYARLVSYSLIALASLQGIYKRKFNNALFLGDIVMVVALFLAGLHTNVLHKESSLFADLFLTPAAIFWAIVHFFAMLKNDRT